MNLSIISIVDILTKNSKKQEKMKRKTSDLDLSKSIIEQKSLAVNCPSFYHSVISPTGNKKFTFDLNNNNIMYFLLIMLKKQ